jgi:hypothetical protein
MVPCCMLWWLRVRPAFLVCVVCGVQLSAQESKPRNASPTLREESSNHSDQSALCALRFYLLHCTAHCPVRVLETNSEACAQSTYPQPGNTHI